jgi:RNA polymerase sigma-70 factor (ECF subfamily)
MSAGMVEAIDIEGGRDRPLVRRMQDGQAEALRELVERYGPTAKALALRVVRDPALAEEVVQETFLQVWRAAGRFDPSRGSVRTWVLTSAHARAVDLVRREEAHRRRVEAVAAVGVPDVEDPAEAVVERVAAPEEREKVRAALDRLPAPQREVIELMYFDGMSQTQVAERLAIPLGTVKSRTLLGMRKMRAALAGDRA